MPVFEKGKYGALIAYILLAVLIGCVLVAGALFFYHREPQRPGQPSPHALDQSQ
ncbi:MULTISPECIES: hypothetical protein [unclassified Rhizobium]|uniref:hypothetical protein n=1 Tax=unclassified Rhizobium TaxID=2613769 RepID=UPI00254AA84C|nr:hypothetical protein [Rhizobium sp. CNPSo 4062]MDK4702211.1 hypothetical protein [Rhizobium sp. CNPSo 4062]